MIRSVSMGGFAKILLTEFTNRNIVQ